jgi:hypothetical protein
MVVNDAVLVYNLVDTSDPSSQVFGQPQLVDIANGATTSLLEPGDVAVAVVDLL